MSLSGTTELSTTSARMLFKWLRISMKQGNRPANSRKRWAEALMEVRSLFGLNSLMGNGRTDKASYRVACSRLKRGKRKGVGGKGRKRGKKNLSVYISSSILKFTPFTGDMECIQMSVEASSTS